MYQLKCHICDSFLILPIDFNFRGSRRFNLRIMRLFGSWGRKSVIGFPSKSSADFTMVGLVHSDSKLQSNQFSFWSKATDYLPFLSQGLSGGILCSFKIDDGSIPINKNLWSLSFVLVTSSIAFILLTALYVFIDVLAWWSGAPFRYAGNYNSFSW